MKILALAVVLGAVSLTAAAAGGAESTLGANLYRQHCAACHGAVGEGDGPVAAVMQASVPNLRTLQQRSGGVFPSEAVTAYVDGRNVKAAHGSRQMPIWGDVFATDDLPRRGEDRVRGRIAAIVAFIEELQYR